MEIYYWYVDSPLGAIEISYDKEFVYAIHFKEEKDIKKIIGEKYLPLVMAISQLTAYFSGTLRDFDLPLNMKGTDFQNKVWRELGQIPFGKTISYLQLARKLGDEKCIRAAASANGKNPFAIVIPCHRVIGSDGSLTGYAGGMWRKQWLLEHEAKVCGTYQKLF